MRYVETGKPPTGRELRLTSGKPERWTINAAHWQVCEGTNCEADAALIAAAPEMFEALRELVKWMDDSGLSATSPGGVGPLHYGTTEYSVVTAARAAIAKAEGR
jgi:hypothetical protein